MNDINAGLPNHGDRGATPTRKRKKRARTRNRGMTMADVRKLYDMVDRMRLFLKARTTNLPPEVLARFPDLGSIGRFYLRQELNAAMDIICCRCIRRLIGYERAIRGGRRVVICEEDET